MRGMSLGLGLSKRRAIALGPELVVNGGFADASSWTTDGTVTISGGKANFANTADSLDSLYQLGIIPAGGTAFTIAFTVSNYVKGSVRPFAGSQALGTAVNANGTYTFSYLDRGAGNANLVFKGLNDGVNGNTFSIDDVSLKVQL